ncbi:DUF3907 family protein [Halobacillus naozhouensis]|uniref:DUF3907 family protein n=1 Tax=Halobacillus naozhouensis TaxID=554880 RepID=A0ABY8IX53_9BACI|nr:DUF3907 family protein [Halobacillus naozhouensis]WFT73145.1 DUF3907 family protein [Halobacillus naozhouensis]
MRQQMIKEQTIKVQEFLREVVFKVDDYLDTHSLHEFEHEHGHYDEDYYRQLLKSLRRLNVLCDEAKDKVAVLLKGKTFQTSAAERTLYGIYHQCIGEFYSPKGDTWFEDSRASYTGNNSITFQFAPPASLVELFASLGHVFQDIREELDCYENHDCMQAVKK